MMPLLEADTLISLALREDIGDGDITTSAVIQKTAGAAARLIAQQRLVVAGLDMVQRVFEKLDPEVKVRKNRADAPERWWLICRAAAECRRARSGYRAA